MPPIFVFVVDVSARQTELDALKDSLEMALNLIPEDCLVGLITTGTVVQVIPYTCVAKGMKIS